MHSFFPLKVSFVFQKDRRHYITLSTFGFYKGGILTVNLTNFKFEPADVDKKLTPESANKAVVSCNKCIFKLLKAFLKNLKSIFA